MMNNQELVATLSHIADLLSIKGENFFVVQAYRTAADNIYELSTDVNDLHRLNRLGELDGIGKALMQKIGELLDTGKLGFLEELENEVPPTLGEMFWKQLGITTIKELEEAANQGKLRTLPGMGEKTEARIIAGIQAYHRRSKRILLNTAWSTSNRWLDWLRQLDGVQRVEVAGSLRRWKTTIGNLDFAACAANPLQVAQVLSSHPDVARPLSVGEHRTSVELNNGLILQLWMQPAESFGTLLQYATGSKEHNIHLREFALARGYSLSEHSITGKDGVEHYFTSEEEVYSFLGLDWIPPELREDHGEITAAETHALPVLIQRSDLKSDLHTHSTWSDAANTIEEMAVAARERGLKVLAITDHSGGLGIAYGLSVEKLRSQRKEIRRVQKRMGNTITLLQGSEVEILADGSLDFPDRVLAELDIVVASLHMSLRQPRQVITERLLRVLRHPHVDVIGHLSGRLLPNREGADLDMEAVLETARQSGVAFEINSNPARLDMDESYVRQAVQMGIPILINTDSHAIPQLDYATYGISAARRSGLTAEQIINTWEPDRLLAWLKK
jgi:DNA polymerase (family 10)